MRTRSWAVRCGLLLGSVVLLTAVGCGSDDDSASSGTSAPAVTETSVPPETTLPAVPDVSDMYADLGLWHCHPDLVDDVCSAGFDATRVDPDGSLHPVPFTPAADPQPGDTRELSHIETRLADSASLHTLDYNFSLSDLLALVRSQTAAYEG